MSQPRLLLVEPDSSVLMGLLIEVDSTAIVDVCHDFEIAREWLWTRNYDRVVTNLRLDAYNGLHLAYVTEAGTRFVIYTARRDVECAKEVQTAGAFYESYDQLKFSIASYVRNDLPPTDRRDPGQVSRRHMRGGGRRCSDPDHLASPQ